MQKWYIDTKLAFDLFRLDSYSLSSCNLASSTASCLLACRQSFYSSLYLAICTNAQPQLKGLLFLYKVLAGSLIAHNAIKAKCRNSFFQIVLFTISNVHYCSNFFVLKTITSLSFGRFLR